jgi:hypothetical protein
MQPPRELQGFSFAVGRKVGSYNIKVKGKHRWYESRREQKAGGLEIFVVSHTLWVRVHSA